MVNQHSAQSYSEHNSRPVPHSGLRAHLECLFICSTDHLPVVGLEVTNHSCVDPVQGVHTLHVGGGVEGEFTKQSLHLDTTLHTHTHTHTHTHYHTHTCNTHKHTRTCHVPRSHILMRRSSDPLMMRLLSNCSVVTAALWPLRVRFISYVDRSQTMIVQSPEPDTNLLSLNWTQRTWSVCPLHTARTGNRASLSFIHQTGQWTNTSSHWRYTCVWSLHRRSVWCESASTWDWKGTLRVPSTPLIGGRNEWNEALIGRLSECWKAVLSLGSDRRGLQK